MNLNIFDHSFRSPQKIAEEILGNIDWVSNIEGYCTCPGHNRHTTNNGWRDCRVMLDGAPTVYCVHQSCREEIDTKNYELRSTLARESLGSHMGTHPRGSHALRGKPNSTLKTEAERALPIILETYAWSLEEMRQSSPVQIPDGAAAHYHLYLQLFQDTDCLWIGHTYDSGEPRHCANFQLVSNWKAMSMAPAPLICPSTFRKGTYSRTQKEVIQRLLWVVECDRIDPIVDEKLTNGQPLTDEDKHRNKVQSAAVLRWLRDAVGLHLRAVVDAGNKSIHGHFDPPPPDYLDELKSILPGLKCDPQLFKDTQPVRLPGGLRDGRFQELLFLDLNPKGGVHDAIA